jgi:hypothetical protein
VNRVPILSASPHIPPGLDQRRIALGCRAGPEARLADSTSGSVDVFRWEVVEVVAHVETQPT